MVRSILTLLLLVSVVVLEFG